MVEIMSALANAVKPGRHGAPTPTAGVTLGEVRGRDLTQVGAWHDSVDQVRGVLAAELGFAMPSGTRQAAAKGDVTVFMTGPDKWWITAPYTHYWHKRLSKVLTIGNGIATDLGHSRTIVSVSGPRARDLLLRTVAVDLDQKVFPMGSFASSGIHGVGVLVHHVSDAASGPCFHVYIPYTFGLSVFEGLSHLAEQWGVAIE